MRASPLTSLLTLLVALLALRSVDAQEAESAPRWNALLEQTQGWLAADGIYSLDLNLDSKTGLRVPTETSLNLFWFSDTFCGSTQKGGKEFGDRTMVNHSFAVLEGTEPDPEKIAFFFDRTPEDDRIENIVEGHYWLQDGVRFGDKLWISAILVGNAWKPERIDALTIELDADGRPDFATASIDTNAPLSMKTETDLLDLGAAICDDAQDGYVYVYGYVDRLNRWSRKDLVVARVPQDAFLDYAQWRYYDGKDWTETLDALLDPSAALVRGVSTEYSVSKIPSGKNKGKYLLVYTPGTIGSKVACRVADSPIGPFGEERILYESTVPQELPGVRCYNAKAHPIFATENALLLSYNVNRLGDVARTPEEYRPHFLWIDWNALDKIAVDRDSTDAR